MDNKNLSSTAAAEVSTPPLSGIIKKTLIGGFVVFLASWGGLYTAISMNPQMFIDYINPIFNSDGSRDMFFYIHPFVLCLSLAILWNRFQKYFHGSFVVRGLEFGFIYAVIALIPVMWITYSAVDVSMTMVFSWLLYGLAQACLAGVVFAWLERKGH